MDEEERDEDCMKVQVHRSERAFYKGRALHAAGRESNANTGIEIAGRGPYLGQLVAEPISDVVSSALRTRNSQGPRLRKLRVLQ